MKMLRRLFFFINLVAGLFLSVLTVNAEVKINNPSCGTIPKLPKTENDPYLFEGHVYPFWGPVCQRYTYSVIYRDEKGRPPEYVRIYFNGKMIDIDKSDSNDTNYQKGVRYQYRYVPDKLGSNFYFFEASNGVGKARASIIDSPDNGPVLFEGDFKDNEIALIDASGNLVWRFPVGEEWVGGVALSDDGRYLAAQTNRHVYLFNTDSAKPVWTYTSKMSSPPGGDVKGGIDISTDGSMIFTALGSQALLFNQKSNKPVWQYDIGNSAYSAAVSKDGEYLAIGTAGSDENQDSNLLILWNKKSSKPLWQYHASGNFHEVSLSNDGAFVAAATGCPDRRAYIFSKDSNEPILRTEMLTRDSPVDEAQISGSGDLAAFGLESDQGGLAIYDRVGKKQLWRFETPKRKSVRALSITDDGQLIAAATFGGQVYIFNNESNKPLASWSLDASMGAVEISDDGRLLAVGGADSKVHLLNPQDKTFHRQIVLSEYVGEIDVAANGKYVAAGTSGSVYFFETFSPNEGKIFPCVEIVEPVSEAEMRSSSKTTGSKLNNLVGVMRKKLSFFEKILNFFKNILGIKTEGGLKQAIQPDEKTDYQLNGQNQGNDQAENLLSPEKQGVCGNNVCEPDLGETKESCPGDCSNI
ncbi:PQQ-binding-like beta-propeller repeat protein [Patescibacteria group bacterium]|nr:PQQ-binding-like beta-propeller repeat protein [Patescibacteria group bacterium]